MNKSEKPMKREQTVGTKFDSVILKYLSSLPQAQGSDTGVTNDEEELGFLVETKPDPELVKYLSSLPEFQGSETGATDNIDDDESDYLVETKLDFKGHTLFPPNDTGATNKVQNSKLESEKVLQSTPRAL